MSHKTDYNYVTIIFGKVGTLSAKAEILCKATGAELGQLISIDYNWGELNIISRTNYEMEDCLMPLSAMNKCCAPEIEDVHSSYARTGEELKRVEARLREVQPLIKNIAN